MKYDFKYLEDDTTALLFHKKSLDFFRIYDEKIKEILKSFFLENKDCEEVHSILEGLVDNKNQELQPTDEVCDINTKEISLNKLTLIVTNNCNFKCKYCYADGGNYGFKVQAMSEDEAKKIIDYFTQNFKEIRFVQIFGGEPLLNCKTVKYICEYFRELKMNGIINYMPEIGMVTNGVLVSKEVIHLIKEFNIYVTFSLDGDQYIHDLLRIDNEHNGTYIKVKERYFDLINSGVNKNLISFECTYTKAHIDNKISFVDLLEFFKREFKCNMVHIATVCINSDDALSLNDVRETLKTYTKELVNYTFNKILEEKVITSTIDVVKIIDRLINKDSTSQYICPSILKSVSVTPEGTIYPCFVLTGTNSCIGNIGESPEEMRKKLKSFILKHNMKNADKECTKCWANNICSLCLISFGKNLDCKDKSYGANMMCDTFKIILETTLLNICKIKSSREQWEIFQSVISNAVKSAENIS